MQKGMYTATSGLLTLTRDMNVRGNNISNLNTAGYKEDRLITSTFAEALALRQDGRIVGNNTVIGNVARGKKAVGLYTNFTQGSFEETNRSLDFALSGNGFFAMLDGNDEIYFTRNGQFQIDEEGYLINGLGHYVLDETESPIYVERYDFTLNQDGNIITADGEDLGRFYTYVPDDPHLLVKSGEGEYRIREGYEPEELEFTGTVIQGYIEAANTNIATEMAAMMSSSRSYQSISQMIKTFDSLLAKAISDVGRV